MDEFYQGLIAGVGILGGICAFNYWMFALLEKRIETKLDSVSSDIHKLVLDLREERKSKDMMYQFVLESSKKGS